MNFRVVRDTTKKGDVFYLYADGVLLATAITEDGIEWARARCLADMEKEQDGEPTN